MAAVIVIGSVDRHDPEDQRVVIPHGEPDEAAEKIDALYDRFCELLVAEGIREERACDLAARLVNVARAALEPRDVIPKDP